MTFVNITFPPLITPPMWHVRNCIFVLTGGEFLSGIHSSMLQELALTRSTIAWNTSGVASFADCCLGSLLSLVRHWTFWAQALVSAVLGLKQTLPPLSKVCLSKSKSGRQSAEPALLAHERDTLRIPGFQASNARPPGLTTICQFKWFGPMVIPVSRSELEILYVK